MAISSLSNVSANDYLFSTDKAAEDRTSLSMDDFFKLIAAELTNQDMNSSADNSEMLNQMVQMASIEAMNALTTQSTQSYASSLLGQKIQVWNIVNGELTTTTGTVTGVNMLGEAPIIYLDGQPQGYDMSQIASVGEIPKDTEDSDSDKEDGPTDGGDSSKEEASKTRSVGNNDKAANDKVTNDKTAANDKIARQTAGNGPAVASAAQAAGSSSGSRGPAAGSYRV